MAIEQYFGGRVRYNIQIGDNGDKTSGIGCYARSSGTNPRDIATIKERYKQYVSKHQDEQGHRPTIYKRMLLPSGTILLSATSYIPPLYDEEQGKTVDRAIWIDHCYLMRPDDPETLDPEKWMGLYYKTVDPNPTIRQAQDYLRRRQNGDHSRPEFWLRADSLDSLPTTAFSLLPLRDVLSMWKMKKEDFLGLVEAAMDCVAAKDDRKLFIIYDLNGKDCANDIYWDRRFYPTAEDYNCYRFGQLLCWIYHLIPFSFRRRLSYDTLLNQASHYHQIIFTPANTFRMAGKQPQFTYYIQNQQGELTNSGIRLLDAGYMFVPGRGTVHSKNSQYIDLYQGEGTVQRLLQAEVESLADLETIEDCRAPLDEYYQLFAQMEEEKRIHPFSQSISELENEIPRYRPELMGSAEELQKTAKALLAETGEKDIANNADNLSYFNRVANALKTKREEQTPQLWSELVVAALSRPQFQGQWEYVQKLVDIIRQENDPAVQVNIFLSYDVALKNAPTKFEEYKISECLFIKLTEDDAFVHAWLDRKFKEKNTYSARFEVFKKEYSFYGTLPSDRADVLRSALSRYMLSLPQLWATDELVWLLCVRQEDVGPQLYAIAEELAQGLCGNLLLPIYRKVEIQGPQTYLDFCSRIQESSFACAETLLLSLLDVVFDKWLPGTKSGELTADALAKLLSLVPLGTEGNSGKQDGRIDAVNRALREGKTFSHFTPEQLQQYLKALEQEKLPLSSYGFVPTVQLFLCNAAIDTLQTAEKASPRDLVILFEALHSSTVTSGNPFELEEARRNFYRCFVSVIGAAPDLELAAEVVQSLELKYALESELQLREAILDAAGKVVPRQAEHATKENLDTFDRACMPWKKNPEVRQLRRQLTKNLQLYPSFDQVSKFANHPSSERLEELQDNGFEYNFERPDGLLMDTVLERLLSAPSGMNEQEWMKHTCDWIEEALKKGKLSFEDRRLLDVLCEAVLTSGIRDSAPGACVNQEWLVRLASNKVLKKAAESSSSLLNIKKLCDLAAETAALAAQPGSAKWSKPQTTARPDPDTRNLIVVLIRSGKLRLANTPAVFSFVGETLKHNMEFFKSLLCAERAEWVLSFVKGGNLPREDMRALHTCVEEMQDNLSAILDKRELEELNSALVDEVSAGPNEEQGAARKAAQPGDTKHRAAQPGDTRHDTTSEKNRKSKTRRSQSKAEKKPQSGKKIGKRSK